MIHIIDIILFVWTAFSVVYVSVFAIASLFASRHPSQKSTQTDTVRPNFLILIPAYAEDKVIISTARAALAQEYDSSFTVCVIADHLQPSTLDALKAMPMEVCEVHFADSTKGKALHEAMKQYYKPQTHTHIVILDADNIIHPDFLERLAGYCTNDVVAIQAHRCAKNMDTPVAVLDALSEEINNSIFRLGHNRLGLSSALIGSGMCFRAEWFAAIAARLETAGEDKELERHLLFEGHKVVYVPDLDVLDEKVSDSSNFGKQRRRWLAAQFFTLRQMLRFLPQAICRGRINYIDKTIQQALIPRSLLIAQVIVLTLISTILTITLDDYCGAVKWWVLTGVLFVSLLCAVPRTMYRRNLYKAFCKLPALICRMFSSLLHVRGASHKYIHTQHSK